MGVFYQYEDEHGNRVGLYDGDGSFAFLMIVLCLVPICFLIYLLSLGAGWIQTHFWISHFIFTGINVVVSIGASFVFDEKKRNLVCRIIHIIGTMAIFHTLYATVVIYAIPCAANKSIFYLIIILFTLFLNFVVMFVIYSIYNAVKNLFFQLLVVLLYYWIYVWALNGILRLDEVPRTFIEFYNLNNSWCSNAYFVLFK